MNQYLTDCHFISSRCDLAAFSGKRVLVTGVTGLIGSQIFLALRYITEELGVDVNIHVIARMPGVWPLNLSTKICIHYVDLCKDFDLDFDFDIVIHAASIASPSLYKISPAETMLPNIFGTSNLLKHTKKCGTFVFVSSGEVYGNLGSSVEIDEGSFAPIDPRNLRNIYAESKRAGEALTFAIAATRSIKSIIVRPFHTYGANVRKSDERVFADFIWRAARGQKLFIRGDGSVRRSFCHVADVVVGIFRAISMTNADSVFNLGNPYENLSIQQLAEVISNLPQVKVNIEFGRHSDTYLSSDIMEYNISINKARQELNWQPEIGIIDGITRAIHLHRIIYDL
ncbi:NAD-dependent epimerase/dehydratase family protein [Rhodobacterales bacterium HKCCA1288]|nr:NAD-dependent epimerase/dehydratase family protein [Rhodobacterales bacterium HKCCA1288]